SVTSDASYEATWVTCSTLAKDHKLCLDLVPEMMTAPAFAEAEIARAKEALLAEVQHRLDDADALASVHVQNLLWGNDHVRGWVPSETTVGSLKRDDLVAWHKAWFVPGNTILVVTGDVDAKKLKGDLERTFGKWAKGPVPPTPTF